MAPSKRDRIERVIQDSDSENKVDQWKLGKMLLVVADPTCEKNRRILRETTVGQFYADWEVAVSPKYRNRFLPLTNFFSESHNRNLIERRKSKKQKELEAKQLAEQELEHDSKSASGDWHSQDGSVATIQRSFDSSVHSGPPPKIIGGSKRSVWSGSGGSKGAKRPWDKV